jgi:hypothetical protein
MFTQVFSRATNVPTVSGGPALTARRTPFVTCLKRSAGITTLAFGLVLALPPSPVGANGFGESRPWQFMGPSERSVRLAAVDLIERKKGGFYDSFQVNNFNTTNIGQQINCNNVADATANRSAQEQTANSPNVDNSADVIADAAGNVSDSQVGTGGGTGTGGAGSSSTAQDNSGSVSSGVEGSSSSSSSGPINSGTSNSAMNNDQNNSGQISAGVDGIACAMDGEFNGFVESYGSGGPSATAIAGSPLN